MQHVMIVEDNDNLSRMYEKVLRHAGFRTRHYDNVHLACQNLIRFNPDVIVLDWQLHDANAADLLDVICSMPRKNRPMIFIVSGQVTQKELTHYREIIQAFETKPISIKYLVHIVRDLAMRPRTPLVHIAIHELAPGLMLLVWQGKISVRVIQETMHPKLFDAETIIFDIQDLTVVGLDLNSFYLHNHPMLPNLRNVNVVFSPETIDAAEFVVSFLPPQTPRAYFDNLEEAISSALAVH